MKISIDGKKTGREYFGAGMVSGNNSSRLLIDYKHENPEMYREILEHIFGADGLNITLLKLEMGSDINSSSGTEPCVMRFEEEPADVTRGAGYILAADAKKINPDIMLDMLFWSEPKWVTDSADVYAARYKWYAETLRAAYEKFGLKFDFVSASRNEREIDGEWIKYFSERLKSETDCPYDFAGIKIVAADEENSWRIGDMMISDGKLRQAVDVIGSHYTSHSTENVKTLVEKYGKTVWFTEGSPPMNYSKGTARFDGSGLAGLNGVLDVACRIAAMYPCGGMSLYEYQPAIAAYYDGVTFCHKQLITANEPWSEFYSLESGYFMALHFSRFFKRGWRYIEGASFCDGEKGGDGHALVNTVYCFTTAADEDTGDYSTVIVNPTDTPLRYEFEVTGSEKASQAVEIWETVGPNEESYFQKIGSIIPEKREDRFEFSLTVKPFSMVTVSTLDAGERGILKNTSGESAILKLPYRDDFSYGNHAADYLPSRGFAPRYTTDQGGAFEVKRIGGRNLLMQVITPSEKAMEWGGTPSPETSFGDDRWYNYEFSADVYLEKSGCPEENYAGIGLRYNFAAKAMSGYSLLAFEDGSWQFLRNGAVMLRGDFAAAGYPLRLKISAEGRKIMGYIDGTRVFDYTVKSSEALIGGGRAALYSSYNRNCFGDVEILPIGGAYVARFDDTDSCFGYSEGWEHRLMSGFADYKRTVSIGSAGEFFTFEFEGCGFGIFGANGEECVISAELDGVCLGERISLPESGSREVFFSAEGLALGRHCLKVTVVSGRLCVDGGQVLFDNSK